MTKKKKQEKVVEKSSEDYQESYIMLVGQTTKKIIELYPDYDFESKWQSDLDWYQADTSPFENEDLMLDWFGLGIWKSDIPAKEMMGLIEEAESKWKKEFPNILPVVYFGREFVHCHRWGDLGDYLE